MLGLTGNALPDDIANYFQAGATDVLLKPLSIAKLQKAIETHILK